ncbi:MAG: N-acetyl-gamma-glutamyl-phosphate reductase [Porticoccaceae bacterium]|nr:N-acetyl-gamma-glutamyl-phosphate reductase [Porticoccaceae bacterium]
MINVGIVGGSGYTGAELLRLLVSHPDVKVVVVTSRSCADVKIGRVYPNLARTLDICFSVLDLSQLQQCDVVFFTTPHGVSQTLAPKLLNSGIKVIDLSADFRIRDIAVWERWYGVKHRAPELIPKAVYGLPEFNDERIREADLIACPGCYPTSIQLGLLPLLRCQHLDTKDIIVNASSGVSGAGRTASLTNIYTEVGDNYKAYAADGHRHLPEVVQGLRDISGRSVEVTFVPHLLPINRGIHATIFVNLTDLDLNLHDLYTTAFVDKPFVSILPLGDHPQTRNVRGSNFCQIGLHRPFGGRKAIILVVIDNLIKGASGQAIQCMNLMFDLPETCGLTSIASVP